MTNSDTFSPKPRDVAAATGLLTRLPVRVDSDWAAARGADAAWAYPLVGLILGVIGALTAVICGWFGLAEGLAAGLVLVALAVVTGALHEDGLADCADGFWGGWDKARRLDIMKDSRIGAYGVLALIFAVGLKWAALAEAFAAGWLWGSVLVPAVISRAAMVVVMHALPHARRDGLSQSVGRAKREVAIGAVAIAGVVALVFAGWVAIWAGVVAAAVTLAVMALARAKIAGQTGDVLGATQQVVEIAVLLVIAAAG